MTPRPALPLALALSLASGLLLGSGVAAADPPKPATLIPAPPPPPPPPPPPAEPVEMKTRSPEMVVGGFFLGLGGAAALAGGLTYATNACVGPPVAMTSSSSTSKAPSNLPCVDPGARTGVGAGVAVLGGIAVAGGIALVFLGAKQVPAAPGTGALPAVRVGAGSASATWSF